MPPTHFAHDIGLERDAVLWTVPTTVCRIRWDSCDRSLRFGVIGHLSVIIGEPGRAAHGPQADDWMDSVKDTPKGPASEERAHEREAGRNHRDTNLKNGPEHQATDDSCISSI